MHNQDEVAEKLARIDIRELLVIMLQTGRLSGIPWAEFVRADATIELINSRGWSMRAFIKECRKVDPHDISIRYVANRFCGAASYYTKLRQA